MPPSAKKRVKKSKPADSKPLPRRSSRIQGDQATARTRAKSRTAKPLMVSEDGGHPLASTRFAAPATPESMFIDMTDEWERDYETCRSAWAGREQVEGFVGMIATISDLERPGSSPTIRLRLEYGDIEGEEHCLSLELAFQAIADYPDHYGLDIHSADVGRRQKRCFARFAKVYGLDIQEVVLALLAALQGDDEARGGQPRVNTGEETEEEVEEGWDVNRDRSAIEIRAPDIELLRKHFLQAKGMGYRPGWSRVSDFWVYSLSIPLKNLEIEPNTLAMWDDGLVDAWKSDMRIVLLVGCTTYPPKLGDLRYWLALHKNYKPSEEEIVQTTRGAGLPTFFMATTLQTHLKSSFGKSLMIRTSFQVDWDEADQVGFDEQRWTDIQMGKLSLSSSQKFDSADPISQGFEHNLPLVAFWWTLRRFVSAPAYCMNCGQRVATQSLRPYVCASNLCLYGYMSLGLGPSVEHVIKTQPSVVDLLLSFAHAAARSQARMSLPLHLSIELPADFTNQKPLVIDECDNQKTALAWLVEQLPKVSDIKALLEQGYQLRDIKTRKVNNRDVPVPAGSIGVLRWVVGSCLAYLKEVRPGEGVRNGSSGTINLAHLGTGTETLRQFAFVVGSAEQEANFKAEIRAAQKADHRLAEFPTMLAFHGSSVFNWHNILRTGLDFQETANGRAYGHGVYFAPDAQTSMSGYSKTNTITRPNADFPVTRATAIVELVNVPNTFISRSPYYVVSNLNQIKCFMLLVQGLGDAVEAQKTDLPLFQHDPKLAMPPKYFGQILQISLPQRLGRASYEDTEPDLPAEQRICGTEPKKSAFERSPQSRYDRLEVMPAPVETSIVASRALGKEFKALVKQQLETGDLPFFIDPENDSLYCWTLELFDFPESRLKSDMEKYNVRSIIAEIRFPASFPHSPPFMRLLHPRCLPFQNGGGGNITGGGSICNEIMTSTGWNPAFCIEAIVRDVMTNMTEAMPPARLDPSRWDLPYNMREAAEAYRRVAQAHGWQIPKDFAKISR